MNGIDQQTSRQGKPVILLVDDDDGVREFLACSLEFAGYRVIQANSGHDAIAKYTEHEQEIALVLSDIVMPGLFGDQLALRLLDFRPTLKIVLMSGNPPNSLETAFTLVEGKNFLRKPFSIEDLSLCLTAQLQHSSVN